MKKTTPFILAFLISILSVKGLKAQFSSTDTVPLIIHVIHNSEAIGAGRNLNAAQIASQFSILNSDFAGQGWNFSHIPSVWSSLVANTHIVFVPALVDTNGVLLSEPGVDRIDRNSKGWSNTATMNSVNLQAYLNNTIKPQSIWNTNNYCNVWILDMGASGLLGYSTFPANSGLTWITGGTGNATNDGVCVHYKCWGDTLNTMAPYNHGRTATHEFGHWLGLPHMFNGCGAQVIADLPIGNYNQSFSSPVFPDVADTCSGYPNGPMFMNFMCNAINDSDIYMFTLGQAIAMRQAYTNSHGSLKLSNVGTITSVASNPKSFLDFKVFPNPSSGIIHITSNLKSKKIEMKALNNLGESVYEEHVTNFAGCSVLDLSKQSKGLYFIEMRCNDKSSIQKIMIQ